MTIQEFAKRLDGRQYGQEISAAEAEQAEQLGYIVVMGYRDDLCEIYGVFREEYDCYCGGIIQDARLPKPITAVWHDTGVGSWSYETDMPHAEFNIFEDDELYCVGIVVDLYSKWKTKKMTNYERIKNMTVEEMAEFINEVTTAFNCEFCAYCEDCPADDNCCARGMKEWLESEVSK